MGLCDDAADKINPIFPLSHFLIVFFDFGTLGQRDDETMRPTNKYCVADTIPFTFHLSLFSLYCVADAILLTSCLALYST